MFKWTSLGAAALVCAVLLWMVNDLRVELKRTTATLNAQLPQILDRTRVSTDTLAELSADIRQMRDLLGATGPRDRSLVAFADAILDQIETSGGQIGLEKKVFGTGLKQVQPAAEWVVGARKEAALITLTARSREEVLTRICRNMLGSDWYIQVGDAEPQTLRDWLEPRMPADSRPTDP